MSNNRPPRQETPAHAQVPPGTALTTMVWMGSADMNNDKLAKELEELAAEQPTPIQRYEAYWARNPARSHHEIDCPNEACDHRLKVNRPAKGSGEMWDSLAECPYCTGMFFYESRPLRIDVAFKGFMPKD